MNEHWTERLSEYLDGDLDPRDRAAAEAHLHTCASCSATLAELRAVSEHARVLEHAPPAQDLWPAILRRIEAEARPRAQRAGLGERLGEWFGRSFSISVPQLAGAAAALMLVTAAAMWFAMGGPERRFAGVESGTGTRPSTGSEPLAGAPAIGPTEPGSPAATGVPAATAVPSAFDAALAAYSDPRIDSTVVGLQRLLAQERGRLDPKTVKILEKNLAIIDRAVDEARRAVAADPNNPYLRSHLAATMKRKIDLLRQATEIASTRG